jgi:glycine/sarcosine/betaine reductase complex component A
MSAMDWKTKRVIVIGERDGVSGTAIATCLESAGAQIVFVETQCFV